MNYTACILFVVAVPLIVMVSVLNYYKMKGIRLGDKFKAKKT